jgi:hypothetical protein
MESSNPDQANPGPARSKTAPLRILAATLLIAAFTACAAANFRSFVMFDFLAAQVGGFTIDVDSGYGLVILQLGYDEHAEVDDEWTAYAIEPWPPYSGFAHNTALQERFEFLDGPPIGSQAFYWDYAHGHFGPRLQIMLPYWFISACAMAPFAAYVVGRRVVGNRHAS